MNQKTLKALKSSIAHWERLASGKRKDGEQPTGQCCALCAQFFDNHCRGCPVASKTKLTACVGTPYWKASRYWNLQGPDSRQFKTAAKAELQFLKSLLPK